jgi:G3E family GTPase
MIHSFILTGFLGVGKTTMLTNTVKEQFKDKNVAIVVNEFGDVGVDSEIISNVHSEVLEISEGCICCQLATEFEAGVTEIIQKYNPDIIFVETSGASEPFPIFLSLQNLGISVEGVICVIDSKNFDSYKENSTAKYQIGGSNIIVLNKTDLVDENQLADLETQMRELKEEYNIKNTLTGQTIFNNYIINHATNGIVSKEVFEGVYKIDEIIEIDKSQHQHHDHTAKDAITQKVAYFKDDICFGDVDEVLKNIPSNIYRVKGVVKVNDVPNPILINYSFGDVSFEDLPEYDGKSMLILIGENIHTDAKELCEKFPILQLPAFRVSI